MKNKNKPRHYIGKDGLETWRLNGQFHRDDGPVLIQHGSKFWYKYNKQHREDGPAIEWIGGVKSWYLNDKLCRINGPAIEHEDGTKTFILNNAFCIEYDYWKEMCKQGHITKEELIIKLLSIEK